MYLDIIIPSYNNIQGLRQSLNSIGQSISVSEILITIIDDYSNITIDEYQSIIQQYPWLNIQFYKLEQNGGPGIVRQFGIEHTSNPFILMLDCGDVFYTPITVEFLIEHIITNPNINFFNTQTLQQIEFTGIEPQELPTAHRYIGEINSCFHGKILSRKLYQKFRMPIKDSYCFEDVPFILLCESYSKQTNTYMELQIDSFLSVIRTIDQSSLTHMPQFLDHAIQSYCKNVDDILENNHLDQDLQYQFIGTVLLNLYNILLSAPYKEWIQFSNTSSTQSLQNLYNKYIEPYYNDLLIDTGFLTQYYNCIQGIAQNLSFIQIKPYAILDIQSFCIHMKQGTIRQLQTWPQANTD